MPQQHPVILISDRDPNIRQLQEYFLGREGFHLEFADDGQAALELAQSLRPALIVTEILIPKIDGLALCRRLRADPLTRDTPVLVFSILAASGRAREAGATLFLRKPFVDSIFVPAVHDLIASPLTAQMERE